MKLRTLSIIFAAVFALSINSLSAFAVDSPEFGLDLAYASKYVWRGAVFATDGVFQPSLTGSMDELSVNLWGNMDLTDEKGITRKMNEWDYTVDYSSGIESIEGLSYSVGIIGYTFPNGGDSTTEFYAGASYDTFLSPSVTVYKDVEAIDGTYVLLGGGYSVPVADITSIDISGSVGFGSENMNMALYGSYESGAGISDALIVVSAPFAIAEYFFITAIIEVSSILDDDGIDTYEADDNLDPINIIIGLTFSTTF
ncbi:hypothetical protein ACFL5H_02840 [Candidatus Latescibacterota bacterium]